jgi:hypothetical protein
MLEAGLSDEEISAAIHITEEFLDLLAGLALNIAFAKIALEGGNQMRVRQRAEGSEATPRRMESDHPERAA